VQLLIEYVEKTDLTTHQAIGMTKDILFNNSNTLYKLAYEPLFSETPREAPKQLTFNPKSASEPQLRSQSQPPPVPITMPSPPHRSVGPRSDSQISPGHRSASPYDAPPFPPPTKVTSQLYDVPRFNDFMQQNPGIQFVYVQWLDYMAMMRVRILPIKEFTRIIYEGERIGISQGNTGTLQNDMMTPVVNTKGQIYVEPDLRSMRQAHVKDPLKAATVLSYWRSEDGHPLPACPRNNLETLITELQYKHNTTLQVGFEIEATFLRHDKPLNPFNSQPPQQAYEGVTAIHAWSTLTPTQWLQTPMLAEIATSLSDMGIDLQQFHAESGPGQYEFILPPAPPLLAIDALIQTRQVVAQIAALHGLRATLHPKPFGEKGAGSAAHAHISMQPPNRDKDFFVGGVLKHLPALCAFTMPDAQSYGRVVDDQWTGGTWVSWGTQNRECPLRRVEDGRWEIRCLDGLANMYFVMAGIVAAGMLGLSSAPAASPPTQTHDQTVAGATEHGDVGLPERDERPQQLVPEPESGYTEMDLPVNPSTLDDEGRARYGITRQMPTSFDEAYARLKADGELKEALGSEMVRDYLTMKGYEQDMLDKMGEMERREWLIERY
jgi:glutamine synthetase